MKTVDDPVPPANPFLDPNLIYFGQKAMISGLNTFTFGITLEDIAGKTMRIFIGDIGDRQVYVDLQIGEAASAEYTIALNANGGTLPVGAPTKYVAGETVQLSAPERSGYDFLGWYGNADLTGNAIVTITAEDTGDKAFLAKWEPTNVPPTTYHVTIVAGNGGEVEAASGPNESGNVVSIRAIANAGYEFTGWTTTFTVGSPLRP